MKDRLLKWLRCPDCAGELELCGAIRERGEVREGQLRCLSCELTHSIEGFIPRFVPRENYAESFGLQWNRFKRLQLDKYNGTTQSRDRFFRQAGWNPSDLRGSLVLEAGCGAGRFTQICLDAGAEVVSFDLSSSVDACLENHGLVENLHVVQADIYRLPFKKALFQRVFCFGVMQHTPQPKESFLSLIRYLQPGGAIAIDVYRRGIWVWLLPKYYLRVITTRIPPATLFNMTSRAVPSLLPISDFLRRVPFVGLYLSLFVPIANIRGFAPLREEDIRQWAVLDTFDMYAPKHDHPQTIRKVRQWFHEAGLVNYDVWGRRSLVLGRGCLPGC